MSCLLNYLKLLSSCLKCLGAAPFHVDPFGALKVPSKSYLIASTFLVSLATLVGYVCFMTVGEGTYQNVKFITYFTRLYTSILAIQILATTIVRNAYSNKMMIIWNELRAVEELLLSHGHPPKFTLLKCVLVLLMIQIVLKSAYYISMLHNSVNSYTSSQFIGYYILRVMEIRFSFINAEYVLLYFTVQDQCENLNLVFSELQTPKIKFGIVWAIIRFRKIQKSFFKLSDISKSAIQIFGPQVITLLVNSFFFIMTQIYLIISKLYNSKVTRLWYMNTLTSLSWILISCFNLIILIIPVYFCVKRAASIKRSLRNIPIYDGNPAIARNMKSFSLQLMHEDFKITAGGLFNIDLSLAYMIVGALTTYITIIVQFDISYFK